MIKPTYVGVTTFHFFAILYWDVIKTGVTEGNYEKSGGKEQKCATTQLAHYVTVEKCV